MYLVYLFMLFMYLCMYVSYVFIGLFVSLFSGIHLFRFIDLVIYYYRLLFIWFIYLLYVCYLCIFMYVIYVRIGLFISLF